MAYEIYYFKGDIVKLKTGEVVEVVESFGVARSWYKTRGPNGKLIFVTSEGIQSIVKRFSDKKRSWGN